MADKKIDGSLEITGKLNPNTWGYGFSFPSNTSWRSDRTIATEQYVDGKLSSELSSALSHKAELVNGVVPESQLPSYVDDVLEYLSKGHFPSAGEKGKIYVAIDTGFTYRWSGSVYVQIGGSDLSDVVTITNPQTIYGNKTFSNEVKFSSTYNGGTIYSFEADDTYGQLRISHDNHGLISINDSGIMPNLEVSLGSSAYQWKDFYISGNITNGTNSVSVADIATKDYVDASIGQAVTNVLTEEF